MLFTAKCWICKKELKGYGNLDTDHAYQVMICRNCYSAEIGIEIIP